jgi:hypothetical protein
MFYPVTHSEGIKDMLEESDKTAEYLKDWARISEAHFGASRVRKSHSLCQKVPNGFGRPKVSLNDDVSSVAVGLCLPGGQTVEHPNFRTETLSILANKIVYISHPQISSLECTIGLMSCVTLESGHRAEGASILFEQIANEIETIFNIPFERNRKNFSLTFKDEHAMLCLNKLIGSKTSHPLHSLYVMAISHFLHRINK